MAHDRVSEGLFTALYRLISQLQHMQYDHGALMLNETETENPKIENRKSKSH